MFLGIPKRLRMLGTITRARRGEKKADALATLYDDPRRRMSRHKRRGMNVVAEVQCAQKAVAEYHKETLGKVAELRVVQKRERQCNRIVLITKRRQRATQGTTA